MIMQIVYPVYTIALILVAVTFGDLESARKDIEGFDRNATKWLNEVDHKAKNETKIAVKEIVAAEDRAVKWANRAENDTRHAVGAAVEEFDEITRNASRIAAKAIDIAEESVGEWIAEAEQTVKNSTEAEESLQNVGLAAKEFGEMAKNTSATTLKLFGKAGEFVGRWLVGTGKADNRKIVVNQAKGTR